MPFPGSQPWEGVKIDKNRGQKWKNRAPDRQNRAPDRPNRPRTGQTGPGPAKTGSQTPLPRDPHFLRGNAVKISPKKWSKWGQNGGFGGPRAPGPGYPPRGGKMTVLDPVFAKKPRFLSIFTLRRGEI